MTLISMMWPPLICCLPDSLLDFLSCLVNRPLMAADVFPLIEHARKSCCEVNTSLICFYFCHIQSHFLSITRFAVFISTKREVRIQHSSWSFIVNTWQPTHARAIKYFTIAFQINSEIPAISFSSHAVCEFGYRPGEGQLGFCDFFFFLKK